MQENNELELDFEIDKSINSKIFSKLLIYTTMIREPEGVDFVVESRELTDEDRRIFAEHIRANRAQQTQEERNYNRAFTDVVQAVSRLRKAKKEWQISEMA